MLQNLLHWSFYVVPGALNAFAWSVNGLAFMREIVESRDFGVIRDREGQSPIVLYSNV